MNNKLDYGAWIKMVLISGVYLKCMCMSLFNRNILVVDDTIGVVHQFVLLMS